MSETNEYDVWRVRLPEFGNPIFTGEMNSVCRQVSAESEHLAILKCRGRGVGSHGESFHAVKCKPVPPLELHLPWTWAGGWIVNANGLRLFAVAGVEKADAST